MPQRVGKRRHFFATIPCKFVKMVAYPVPFSVFEPSVKIKKVLIVSGRKFGGEVFLRQVMDRFRGWKGGILRLYEGHGGSISVASILSWRRSPSTSSFLEQLFFRVAKAAICSALFSIGTVCKYEGRSWRNGAEATGDRHQHKSLHRPKVSDAPSELGSRYPNWYSVEKHRLSNTEEDSLKYPSVRSPGQLGVAS